MAASRLYALAGFRGFLRRSPKTVKARVTIAAPVGTQLEYRPNIALYNATLVRLYYAVASTVWTETLFVHLA